ncbi:hypothetical protein I79_010567 [Cricetulus griseus]|uniref:Uncharacterized protein n=1 Tax=Cricetulus griseus TaxID=10029 RepID=G3HIU0_CRIGR|nr:hypothetical protein I79_010567 [Cricetulus griseus]
MNCHLLGTGEWHQSLQVAQTKCASYTNASQVVPWALGNFIQVQGLLGVILHINHMVNCASSRYLTAS